MPQCLTSGMAQSLKWERSNISKGLPGFGNGKLLSPQTGTAACWTAVCFINSKNKPMKNVHLTEVSGVLWSDSAHSGDSSASGVKISSVR